MAKAATSFGPREPNAIDFWRGVALLTIFLTHIPGIWWDRLTYRNVSFSDAAELFVFLAGYSLRQIADGFGKREPLIRLLPRLTGRAVTLYAVQIFLTVVAISFIAAAALALDTPLILEWNNAAAVFFDPIRTHVGLVLLTHQLGYFDILPLYVVLMFAAPVIVAIDRVSPWGVLIVSVSLYVAVLWTGFNLPTWPTDGVWFFNPLAWQLVFVLGFVAAREVRPGGVVAVIPRWTRLVAWIVVIAAAIVVRTESQPDPFSVPEPTLFFVIDKTYATPLRLLQFLALVVAMGPVFGLLRVWIGPITRYFSMLGRNALNVFCVCSLGSLAGQLIRFIFGSGILVDTVILILGIIALGLTGWVSEWRVRLKGPNPSERSQ